MKSRSRDGLAAKGLLPRVDAPMTSRVAGNFWRGLHFASVESAKPDKFPNFLMETWKTIWNPSIIFEIYTGRQWLTEDKYKEYYKITILDGECL